MTDNMNEKVNDEVMKISDLKISNGDGKRKDYLGIY